MCIIYLWLQQEWEHLSINLSIVVCVGLKIFLKYPQMNMIIFCDYILKADN